MIFYFLLSFLDSERSFFLNLIFINNIQIQKLVESI